ncbi:N5-glutamine methyltransferase family protein [Derxia gummosa]|uniref:N5-glutamine methyltransferase family protein n=1 Tax=Derxia gummosa DSM 723 TaxID=1121388 RepID=A0AC36KLC0_9BURK|nr:class I SAM-dependent methyltransferase [Derxia gummosa]
MTSPTTPSAAPAADAAPTAGTAAAAQSAPAAAAGAPAIPQLRWTDGAGQTHAARWRSEAGIAPPKRVVLADDSLTADAAYRLACEGTALLWVGDFQNARQLLQAMGRRVGQLPERKQRKRNAPAAKAAGKAGAAAATAPVPGGAAGGASRGGQPADRLAPGAVIATADFHRHRLAQAQRARTLGMLLIPLEGDGAIPLRRAPDVREACAEAWGAPDGERSVVSLRELLGLVGAHEWRRNGVEIGPLGGARIHPHYGVFSPVRGEYLSLLARAPLPAAATSVAPAAGGQTAGAAAPSGAADDGRGLAFDIGTGTGVIAALLARRGVARIVATDLDPRALACAADNLDRLGLADRVTLEAADLFPAGRASLVVCNPPWLPGKPAAPVERAVYDPDSRMLRGFLAGLRDHLAPGGEGWLIVSNLAELLGLRAKGELEGWIAAAGLSVIDRAEARPRHPKALDPSDPLHAARMREVTRLWRLTAADAA